MIKFLNNMKHIGNTPFRASLEAIGLEGVASAHWNLPPSKLILQTLLRGEGVLADSGALSIKTGKFTGRSPKDRFIVDDSKTVSRVDWGEINQKMTPSHFGTLMSDVQEYMDGKNVYVRDAAVGADPATRINVRVVTEKSWSNLFVHNMFLRLDAEQVWLADPAWHIICAPGYQADPERHGCRQGNVSAIDFTRKIIVVAGSGYTGEIKKGMFSVMNFELPELHNVLPMHCSSNVSSEGDVAVFFGLSGTGKTTLSSDPNRNLIGDDEHGWSDDGVFNMEGGCYAKTIDLSAEGEPQIFDSIKYGALLENIGFEDDGVTPNYKDDSITPNTRVSYPVDFIPGAVENGMGGHPTDIFFLTCDAFGVLPPISKLDSNQAMFHFISGYTAKVAGTEAGVEEPQTTFSACFGAPFLPLAPTDYAHMLGERIERHGARMWLVNTGWTGGGYGVGSRMKLSHTRAMITAALNGELHDVEMRTDEVFGLNVPTSCPGVPDELLTPRETWSDQKEFDRVANHLAKSFVENFAQFDDTATDAMRSGGPLVAVKS
ncbi:MAG: phosphoenolpyruvate carboxykinase (ATP) [Flavobacteriales bacterium]|jgi:phosphoenolpyruvate carboxykinase (ATP)|tara:strand:+ start:870 stop:2504 length:1635 start_codon:yes stop_codon:yes gene_type:complete